MRVSDGNGMKMFIRPAAGNRGNTGLRSHNYEIVVSELGYPADAATLADE